MEANNIILGVVVILAILLILFVIKQNKRDEKDLTKFLNKTDKSTDEKDAEYDNDGKKEY